MHVMRVCAGVLALLLISAVMVRAEACPVTPVYAYYAVVGTNAQELEDSLRQHGPRDELGAARFAYTDWTVKWAWKRQDDGTVDPMSVKLTCLATILLPTIESREGLSPELSHAWDGFVERTRQHELNHVAHVQQLAPQIHERLHQAARRPGGVSVKQAELIVADVVAKIKAKDREYDSATTHGRTEGTWRIYPRD